MKTPEYSKHTSAVLLLYMAILFVVRLIDSFPASCGTAAPVCNVMYCRVCCAAAVQVQQFYMAFGNLMGSKLEAAGKQGKQQAGQQQGSSSSRIANREFLA
jgi:hypothetical protein